LKTSSEVRKISPTEPEPQIIKSAVECIRKGGVIAFPTTGLYGLGANALNRDAVERIFRIKKRPLHKPILVLIKTEADLSMIVREVSAVASQFIKAFWPGGLTIIFTANDSLPAVLTGGTGKIGVRMPVHPVARALVSGLNGTLTGTSANISGEPGCSDVSLLDKRVAEQLDLILDAGPLSGGSGSTVVDVTTPKPVIIREGSISKRQIWSFLGEISGLDDANFIDNRA
jgi:L-threonylcarbamoyladenylate synthase